jgi:hypothetical protein
MSVNSWFQNVLLFAVISAGLTACGGGVYVDAPVLEAVGINLNEKEVEEDIPERAGIVIPPSTDKLPKPGETVTASTQSWPQDAENLKKRKEEEEAAAREEYCRNGKWNGGNIDEFEKNTNPLEARCSSRLADSVSKALGGGDAEPKAAD